MEEYKINIKDYELINKLMQTTSSIESLYKRMYDLEVRGLKNTKSYERLLDYLNIALEVENKTYEDANLSSPRCAAIVSFLLTDRLPDSFASDTESIMTQNYNNRVTRRILGVLLQKMFFAHGDSDSVIVNNIVKKYLKTNASFIDSSLFENVSDRIRMQEALMTDMIRTYLQLLQEFLNSRDTSAYRDDLIKSKYNASFINRRVETDLLNNKFEMPNTLVSESALVAAGADIDPESYKFMINKFGIKQSAFQISKLIKMADLEYKELNKVVESIMRQCLMRSAFLFMNDDSISNINYEFYKYIGNDEYLKRYPNNHISEQIIINCFKSIVNDRKKPSVLSLGRINDNDLGD